MKANEFIIAPENAGKSIVEIMQLYSDQQNKEMWEKHDKQIADWKREEKMWGEHELHYKAEIQRLTKEVEELTIRARHAEKQLLRDVKKVWDDGADKRELTRLRELLGKVLPYMQDLKADNYHDPSVGIFKDEALDKLVTDISNALNHKP